MSPVFTLLTWCLGCVIKLKSLRFRKVLFSTDKNMKLGEGIHSRELSRRPSAPELAHNALGTMWERRRATPCLLYDLVSRCYHSIDEPNPSAEEEEVMGLMGQDLKNV